MNYIFHISLTYHSHIGEAALGGIVRHTYYFRIQQTLTSMGLDVQEPLVTG